MDIYTPVQYQRVPIPLTCASVEAGFPSPADDHLESELDLNELLIANGPATFFVRARGESMAGERATIANNDLLVVDRSRKPKTGDVVIACLDGGFTVKRLRCAHREVWLVPACLAWEDVTPGSAEYLLFAVVRSSGGNAAGAERSGRVVRFARRREIAPATVGGVGRPGASMGRLGSFA